jgi:hypothetical protein
MIEKNVIERNGSKAFAIVPQCLLSSKVFDIYEKLILSYCLGKYQTEGWTFSCQSIAIETNILLRTVQRKVGRLNKAAILKLEGYKATRTKTYPVYSFDKDAFLQCLSNDDLKSLFNDDSNNVSNDDLKSENDDLKSLKSKIVQRRDIKGREVKGKQYTKGTGQSVLEKVGSSSTSPKDSSCDPLNNRKTGSVVSSLGSLQVAEGSPSGSVKKSGSSLGLGNTSTPEASDGFGEYVKSKLKSAATSSAAAPHSAPNPFVNFKSSDVFISACVRRMRFNYRNVEQFNELLRDDQIAIVQYVAKDLNKPIPQNVKDYLNIGAPMVPSDSANQEQSN